MATPRATITRLVSALSLLVLFAVSPANGGTLAGLSETLSRLTGTSSIRATVDRQLSREMTGHTPEQGRTSLTVQADASGVSLTYPATEVRRAESEGRERDPDKPRPATSALESVDVVEIASYLNYSSALLRELDGARLRRESNVTYAGQPARLLELELKVRIPKAEARHVKESISTMKLWLAQDGTPLASEIASKFRARFLVITFEGAGKEVRRFARAGDRLLVIREDRRNSGSGIGRSMKQRTITSLRIAS